MSEKRNTLSTAITKKIGGIAKLSHLAAAGQETVNKRRGEVTEFVMTLAREVWQRYDINEDKDKAKIQVFNVLRDACEHIADKDLKARQRKEPQYGIEQGDELPIGNLLSAWQMVCHGISLGVDPTEQDKDEEFIAYTNYRKATELAKEQAKFDALTLKGRNWPAPKRSSNKSYVSYRKQQEAWISKD